MNPHGSRGKDARIESCQDLLASRLKALRIAISQRKSSRSLLNLLSRCANRPVLGTPYIFRVELRLIDARSVKRSDVAPLVCRFGPPDQRVKQASNYALMPTVPVTIAIE